MTVNFKRRKRGRRSTSFLVAVALSSLKVGVAWRCGVVEFLALVYGQSQALEQLILQISVVAGPSIADIASELLQNAQSPFTSVLGSFIAIAFAFSGAIGAFSVLQKSVNSIWEVKVVRKGRIESVKRNFIPFVLITIVGIVVSVWTAFSTVFLVLQFGFLNLYLVI